VNLRKVKLGKKLRGFEICFAWGLMGKKGLSLFLRPEKTQGLYLNIPAYLHCCCPQYMQILEKSNLGKKVSQYLQCIFLGKWPKNG